MKKDQENIIGVLIGVSIVVIPTAFYTNLTIDQIILNYSMSFLLGLLIIKLLDIFIRWSKKREEKYNDISTNHR